ncbi:MAG: hypothetical protein J3R72DRAFT_123764 [Linnemannia gamsii]|nr:MAG: hypothetical protein J3R72DRAFT_123764 [Linnemannia gamsii]
MTEETQLEYEEEYYDEEEEGGDYNEEHDDDANYDYNEDEGGQDGHIQVGQEIDLTHEEVWDDSALIEAWDMAVKQYEVYHSKAGPSVNLKENSKEKIANRSAAPNSSNKHKHTDSTPQPSTSLTKRIKLNHSDGMTTTSQNGTSSLNKESIGTTGSTSQSKARLEPDSSPTPTATQAQRAATSQYDVLERKPSFKKADKPTFNHHKERQEEIEKEKARKEKSSTSAAAPSSLTTAAPSASAPAVDAATIAYYQQLGYYYDPNYVVPHGTETTSLDKEQGLEGDEYEDQLQSQEHQSQQEHGHDHGHRHDGSGIEVEAAGNNKVSGSPHPSSSYSSAPSNGNTKPTTSRAAHKNRAAYTIPNPYGPGPTPQHPSQPPYPTPHGIYPGYYPGHLPSTPHSHIPARAPAAAAGGAFGFPAGPGIPGFPGMSGMPGMPRMVPPGWNASGPAFGHGPSAAGAHGMMPPPPPSSFPHSGGSFAAPKMDDEALGNLIMAWYFSGYYTGLYQAQRR